MIFITNIKNKKTIDFLRISNRKLTIKLIINQEDLQNICDIVQELNKA